MLPRLAGARSPLYFVTVAYTREPRPSMLVPVELLNPDVVCTPHQLPLLPRPTAVRGTFFAALITSSYAFPLTR